MSSGLAPSPGRMTQAIVSCSNAGLAMPAGGSEIDQTCRGGWIYEEMVPRYEIHASSFCRHSGAYKTHTVQVPRSCLHRNFGVVRERREHVNHATGCIHHGGHRWDEKIEADCVAKAETRLREWLQKRPYLQSKHPRLHINYYKYGSKAYTNEAPGCGHGGPKHAVYTCFFDVIYDDAVKSGTGAAECGTFPQEQPDASQPIYHSCEHSGHPRLPAADHHAGDGIRRYASARTLRELQHDVPYLAIGSRVGDAQPVCVTDELNPVESSDQASSKYEKLIINLDLLDQLEYISSEARAEAVDAVRHNIMLLFELHGHRLPGPMAHRVLNLYDGQFDAQYVACGINDPDLKQIAACAPSEGHTSWFGMVRACGRLCGDHVDPGLAAMLDTTCSGVLKEVRGVSACLDTATQRALRRISVCVQAKASKAARGAK